MTVSYRVNPGGGTVVEVEPHLVPDEPAGAYITVTDDSNPSMAVPQPRRDRRAARGSREGRREARESVTISAARPTRGPKYVCQTVVQRQG